MTPSDGYPHWLRASTIFVKWFSLAMLCWLLYLYGYMFLLSLQLRDDAQLSLIMFGDPQMEGDTRIETQWDGPFAVFMNDLYQHHIVQSSIYYLNPTHMFVMGDLFSYQFLDNEEYQRRLKRYNWIFGHPLVSSGEIQLINITGNHDIGYGREVEPNNLRRFEESFGPVNAVYYAAGHVIGVVNSMNLDASMDKELSQQSHNHLRRLGEESRQRRQPLLLFLHIPLHKPKGHCVDPPGIHYTKYGEVSFQYMLSENVSRYILDEIKPKFIFSGHDHYGCFYQHNSYTSEYTIRSMMGDYSGYTAVMQVMAKADGGYEYQFHSTSFVMMAFITVTLIVIACWLLAIVLLLIILSCYRNTQAKKPKVM